jgi:predicted phosphohydrolase
MSIWAIGDLHLSFGCANKEMHVFGPEWQDHHEKIRAFWDSHVSKEDLVLIPGDISWAMKLPQALPDLQWIDERPGTKVMIRGNHDYWWDSASKVRKNLPTSLYIISSDVFNWHGVSIAGARLWDTKEYNFSSYIEMKPKTKESPVKEPKEEDDEKIFAREKLRLETSLKLLNPDASLRICMTHYPPIGATLEDSSVSKMLEDYHVAISVFGHLHSLKPNIQIFGVKNTISYYLVSCDWLQFTLRKIY